MWGLFSNNSDLIDLVYRGQMSEAYKKRTWTINLAFFLLILVSFAFINLIFIKNNESKLILLGLNLLFFLIVLYTIGSLAFSMKSIKNIEDEFISQLEKNKELKNQFKEKSRYIRRRLKRKLIDLKNKKNVFVNSIRGFIDEHMIDNNAPTLVDELKKLKSNLNINEIGTWSWNVQTDRVTIDKTCYRLLNLKESIFAGGYSLFLNFFDRNSRRQLKKDIAYALKANDSFETCCTLKNPTRDKALLLKGNLVYSKNNKVTEVRGVIMQVDSPAKTNNLQKQFLSQPIALFAILDRDFCFEFLNTAWVDHTGYSTHELKNYPLFNFVHQREKRLLLNNLHVLKQDNDGGVKSLKYRFRLNDGSFMNINFLISYEAHRYYLLATPLEEREVVKKPKFDFNSRFQETWSPEFLQS